MMADITPEQAQRTLAQAEESARRVRSHARWMSRYMGVFAGGFGGATLVLGLFQPSALRIAVWSVAWLLLCTGMSAWAARRPAAIRGTGRRTVGYWIATGALYGVALIVGIPHLIGRPEYWVPAALVVAAPLAVGALRERRA